MLGISSPPTTIQGRLHSTQRGSISGSSIFELLVHYRIVQADDLAIHLHRVGQQDGVVIDPQHAFRQAGFSVSRGP